MAKKEKADFIALTETTGNLLFSRFEIFQMMQDLSEEKIAFGCVYPNGKVVIFDSITSNMTVYESIYSLIATINIFKWKVVWFDNIIDMNNSNIKN
jgi:hypothetical protein